jgi:hypothetical protein
VGRVSRKERVSVEDAAKLNRSFRLDEIVFDVFNAKRVQHVEDATWSFTMHLGEVRWSKRGNAVVSWFATKVGIQHAEGEARTDLATMEAIARVTYEVVDALDDANEARIPDFLGIVGWMHAWPYIRSEIQSLSVKLGYPPLTLPILLSGQTSDVPVVQFELSAAGAPQSESSAP